MNDPTSPRGATPQRRYLPPEATLAGYDRWAADYDQAPNPMVAAARWSLDQRPLVVTGADVVEFGCGTGRHAPLLLATGARTFTGVDGSAGMLAAAQRRLVDPRVRWLHAELHTVPLPAASCDLVLVVLVLEHLADLAPMLAEAARLLRPGGMLRVVDIHPDLLAQGTGAHFADNDDEVHFARFVHPLPQLRVTLASSGFVVEQLAEHAAEGDLVHAVPKLCKHAGQPVLVDIFARRC